MENIESTNPEAGTPQLPIDTVAIMQLLPHRYPFLMIDRVVEVVRKQRVVAIKNVTINEPFFPGHFPGHPIMPGVLLLEALAQTGCILVMLEAADPAEKLVFFTGVEHARFRRPVLPGDQVRLEVDVLNWRSRLMRMQGKAFVDGKLVCEGVVTSQMVPRPRPSGSTAEAQAASQMEGGTGA
ncbi:MAG TPA: 3-hydroxyacyl-ACP dehydratase FabZ [Acidobacteriaceae bacterium]|nr:3-hydroxyacyl-ACP dehydratase FabZ [Acidobacteriaceae bacterium]